MQLLWIYLFRPFFTSHSFHSNVFLKLFYRPYSIFRKIISPSLFLFPWLYTESFSALATYCTATKLPKYNVFTVLLIFIYNAFTNTTFLLFYWFSYTPLSQIQRFYCFTDFHIQRFHKYNVFTVLLFFIYNVFTSTTFLLFYCFSLGMNLNRYLI